MITSIDSLIYSDDAQATSEKYALKALRSDLATVRGGGDSRSAARTAWQAANS